MVNPGPATPTGIVTFFDNGVALASADLDASGQATLTLASLAAGDHVLTASYDGEGGFQGSSSDSVALTVAPALTQSTLTTSVARAVLGQMVTLTATISTVTPGLGLPTGTKTRPPP